MIQIIATTKYGSITIFSVDLLNGQWLPDDESTKLKQRGKIDRFVCSALPKILQAFTKTSEQY